MSIEFDSILEYQSFMIALQRQVGRCNARAVPEPEDEAPKLEVLAADNTHSPVFTRIVFDTRYEVLLIDSAGDILMENTRYRVLLHLHREQKLAHLVTGMGRR